MAEIAKFELARQDSSAGSDDSSRIPESAHGGAVPSFEYSEPGQGTTGAVEWAMAAHEGVSAGANAACHAMIDHRYPDEGNNS